MKFLIEPSGNQLRLFLIEQDSKEFLWEAGEREECSEIIKSYQQWSLYKERFIEEKFDRVKLLGDGNKPGSLQGVELRTDKQSKHYFSLDAFYAEQHVGKLGTSFNTFKSYLALGAATTSSSEWVAEEWQGKGLCAEMYKFLEECTGLPQIPHGKTAYYGFQSDQSKKFWEKRAEYNKVFGFNDPIVDQRMERINFVHEAYRIGLLSNRYDVRFNIALAQITGLPVVNLASARYEHPIAAFCLINKNKALCGSGIIDLEKALQEVRDQYKTYRARFKTSTADGLIEILKPDQECLARIQQDYPIARFTVEKHLGSNPIPSLMVDNADITMINSFKP